RGCRRGGWRSALARQGPAARPGSASAMQRFVSWVSSVWFNVGGHCPHEKGGENRRGMNELHATVDVIYRRDSRRVFATLIRLLGDFDLAEEALHDAFKAAIEQWPRDGVPANPSAWLVSAGRFKAIDG